jgi:hypothetical protein
MPWDAVRKILVEDILEGPNPRQSVELMHSLGLGEVLKEMLHEESGFAAALARSLNTQDTHLVLDLLDLGWVVRSPLSFLDRAQQIRLREVLLTHAEDPGFERRFLDSLKRPPIDQVRLFESYGLKGADRGRVTPFARVLLLEDPSLADDVTAWERQVEDEVRRHFKRGMEAQRVVARFTQGG